MTRDYLENHLERKCPSLFEKETPNKSYMEESFQENYLMQDKICLSPNTLPLPVPRPRKPTTLKQLSNLASDEQSKSTTDYDDYQNKMTESDITNINKISTNKDIKPNYSTSNQKYYIVSNQMPCENNLNLENSQKIVNKNLDNFNKPCINANIACSNDNLDKEIETVQNDIAKWTSIDSSSSETGSTNSTPYKNSSYSSTFYPPLIPTTPPPIIDDSSD